MGRHSSPDQGHFYRSFAGWVVVWALIAAVTGAGVWFAVGALGGPEAQKPVANGRDREQEQGPAPTVSGVRVTATPETPEPSATPTESVPADEVELITEDVSVQVLNGTARPGAAQTLADRLAKMGFAIVAVEESSRAYEQTTVFWSARSSRDAAVALAERHGWVADAKPTNLSDTVSLHVVVGADEV